MSEKTPFRMDFVQEIVDWEENDDGSFSFTAAAVPNPDRYERTEIKGKEGWFDTYDGVFISDSVFQDLVGQASGTPIKYSPTDINNIYEYIDEREDKIQSFLKGDVDDASSIDTSDDILNKLAEENENEFVIMSIDLEGSTNLSETLDSSEFRMITQLFQREISILINKFGGYILGYRGDGLIAYFPALNYNGMHDNAADCATSIRVFIKECLNPILEREGLPKYNFRIGIDSGKVDIAAVAPGVSEEMELIGHTINLASKIESVADRNSIFIGETTERNLHTRWRKNTELVEDIEEWNYKKYDEETYNLYRLEL